MARANIARIRIILLVLSLLLGLPLLAYSPATAAPAAGTIERISLSPSGEQGDADSLLPAISADGRYVAFVSDATNLVGGDTNEDFDVFVRDLQTGVTERVSVSTSGEQANGDSAQQPAISPDGRFVA